jgi:cytochrome o ubiquinol oxidase subunit 1
MYWFPKAFGFRLHDGWGKIAFWNWPVGFLLAFMPLYMPGFMDMPRRMEHYANPAWQPYLYAGCRHCSCLAGRPGLHAAPGS